MRQVPLIIEPDPDDPGCATVMVDATVAGRPYRLVLDTGAARSQLEADDYTSGLMPLGEDSSSGAFGGRVTDTVVTITDLAAGPLRVATLDVTRGERGLGGRWGRTSSGSTAVISGWTPVSWAWRRRRGAASSTSS